MYKEMILPEHPRRGALAALHCSPDAKTLVAFWEDGTLARWRARSTRFERVLPLYRKAPEHCDLLSFEEQLYLVCLNPNGRAIDLWDLDVPASTVLIPSVAARDQTHAILADVHGRFLLTREVERRHRLICWELEYPPGGQLPARVLCEDHAISLLSVDPLDDRVALLRYDQQAWSAEIVNLREPKDRRRVRLDRYGVGLGHTFPFGARMDWAHERVICCFMDGVVMVSSFNQSEPMTLWSLPNASSRDVNRGPFLHCPGLGCYVVAHEDDLKFWKIEDGSLMQTIDVGFFATAFMCTRDGNHIVACDTQGRWRGWEREVSISRSESEDPGSGADHLSQSSG